MSELNTGEWYDASMAEDLDENDVLTVSHYSLNDQAHPDSGLISQAKYADGKFVDAQGVEILGVDSFIIND